MIALILFALTSCLFAAGNAFLFFAILLVVSGAAIGIIKTEFPALIGNISTFTADQTSAMSITESCFNVGGVILSSPAQPPPAAPWL